MLNHPMFTFRQGIEVDLKTLLRKLSQVLVHTNAPSALSKVCNSHWVNSKAARRTARSRCFAVSAHTSRRIYSVGDRSRARVLHAHPAGQRAGLIIFLNFGDEGFGREHQARD